MTGRAAAAEGASDTAGSKNVDLRLNLSLARPQKPQGTARSLIFEGVPADSNVTRCVHHISIEWRMSDVTNLKLDRIQSLGLLDRMY